MKNHMVSGLQKFFQWLGRLEFIVLFAALVIVVGTWGFLEIGDEIHEGEIHYYDEWILTSLRQPGDLHQPIGPGWLVPVAIDITALGSFIVLALVVGLVSGYLLLAKKYHAVGLLVVVTLGGAILSDLLKHWYDRPRPDLVPHLVEATSASFPSGHSMSAAVVYLTLGAFSARLVKERKFKVYFVGMALLLTLLVGLSRVYLGVHYPSDVLGGWTAGLVWSLGWWLVVRFLQNRKTVEKAE
jgi:undecaprenyl-diphosphatase